MRVLPLIQLRVGPTDWSLLFAYLRQHWKWEWHYLVGIQNKILHSGEVFDLYQVVAQAGAHMYHYLATDEMYYQQSNG